jgi:1-aminocyclopropane-1-carboxylate deaminase/D-cysteine desulfhydrase-like pyridoxal-dependent ACC family enzyme
VESELVFIVNALRVFAIVAALLGLTWALRRQRREFTEQLGTLLVAQQQARAEAQVLAERVTALATLVAALPARFERPAEAPQPRPRREASPVRSYETARRLARSGASVEEIVATCGVAGSEARLLQRLSNAPGRHESAA